MQSTYWLEKVLEMISLYVNALLFTLQHIVIHAMQLSDVNSLPRSPDLSTCDFHLWGYLKGKVYTNNPKNIGRPEGKYSDWNSENWHCWNAPRVWQYAVHWRTRLFSAPSLTSKYLKLAFVEFPVQSPRPTPTLFYETAERFFRAPPCT